MSNARYIGEVAPTLGRKNLIINGNFRVWQRGSSQTSSGFGSADRWAMYHGGSTKTTSLQYFTLGQTDVPGEPTAYCRTVVSSVAGAGNYVDMSQKIEGVRTGAGQTVTVSFYAKADAAKNIAMDLYQQFGTGGSPSSPVYGIGAQKFALTTSWQKFTATIDVPSISGKTFGTSGDALGVRFWFDAGSNYDAYTDTLGQQSGTFDITLVQIELGDTATDFEYRTYGEELTLCQRYFTYMGSVYGQQYLVSTSTTASYMIIRDFPTTMRSTPTIGYGTLQNFSMTSDFSNAYMFCWYDSSARAGASAVFAAYADAEF